MHKPKKTIKTLVMLIFTLSSLSLLSMQDPQDQQLCSICKKNNATQIKTISKPKTTWKEEWTYESPLLSSSLSSSLGYTNFESPRPSPSPKPSPRLGTSTPPRQRGVHKRPIPTYHFDQCSHAICLECSKASDLFHPDDKGCRLCPYASAYAEHAQCDIYGCENPIKQITPHAHHTHALCNQHTIEITKVDSQECNICYVQKNPAILSQYPLCEVCGKDTHRISIKDLCTHYLCATCIDKSKPFYANEYGCKLCTYLQALAQHTKCDIKTCHNPAEQITRHATHTHGLCNHHNTEIIRKLHYHTSGCKICYVQENPAILNQSSLCEQCTNNTEHITVNTSCAHRLCNLHHNKSIHFKYSPIDYIKNTIKGNTCTTCFIENNPDIPSCVSTRYWGEIALLAAAAGVVIYGAKKIYTWWQDRNNKEEEEKRSEEVVTSSIVHENA